MESRIAVTEIEEIVKKKPRFGKHGGAVLAGGGLLYGFDDCLFNLNTVDACVAHASGMVGKFQAVGDHLIVWATAIFRAVF
jgi:hypothetical protein